MPGGTVNHVGARPVATRRVSAYTSPAIRLSNPPDNAEISSLSARWGATSFATITR